MTTYVEMMIEKYRSRGLMLDSNLVLLYLVGYVNSSLVGGDYARLSAFQVEEVQILKKLMTLFRSVATTAHILTEVSNLVNDLGGARKQAIYAGFVATLEVLGEQQISSYQAARRNEFTYLGLTDSVLAEMSEKFLIVSNDGRMIDLLRQRGLDALKWVEVLGLSA